MSLRISVRAILWTFLGLAVALVSALLAVDIGLIDWLFGTQIQPALRKASDFLHTSYRVNSASIELALKVIGFVATLVLGALGLLKAVHYAHANLPDRLQQYLDEVAIDHASDRVALLAPYASRNLNGDRANAASPRPVKAIWPFARDPVEQRSALILARSPKLDSSIPVLRKQVSLSVRERITIHLVKCGQLDAAADKHPRGTYYWRQNREAALQEMDAALKLDAADVDALECAAKQARALALPKVDEFIDRLATAAQDQELPIRYARALRFKAGRYMEYGKRNERAQARRLLEEARATLERVDVHEDRALELALVNEDLATLYLGLTSYARVVADRIRDADSWFRQAEGIEGAEGRQRTEMLRAQHRAAHRHESAPPPEALG
ncbi:MAG: hypothetical protein ACKVP3_15625 [Hyphomicrobiaceae bacterium]